jgi:hypothetical protein
MQRRQAFLLVLLGLQILSGCRANAAREGFPETHSDQPSLEDAALIAALMTDMATELSPFLPKGTPVELVADPSDRLSKALGAGLAERLHALQPTPGAADKPVLITLWSSHVDGDILIRLSTPSYRLSKVYRRESGAQGATAAAAGPLLVETIQAGGGA